MGAAHDAAHFQFRPRQAPVKQSKPTIKDVARKAGVALGTVSRIVNGNKTVDEELRRHVLQVIKEIGYTPNQLARSMRSNRSLAIGCVVTDLNQPIAAAMISGAEQIARNAGYALVVADFNNDRKVERTILRFMEERKVDGVLASTSSDEDPELTGALAKLPFPIVLWERNIAGTSFPAVLTAHRAGTRAAAEYLVGLGHDEIVLVAAHPATWTAREQIGGVEDAIAASGRPVRFDYLHTDTFNADLLAADIADKGKSVAVIANIHDIPSIVQAARARNRDMPDDFSLVSIGDSQVLEVITPPVTAIRGEPRRIGSEAARILIDIIENKQDNAPVQHRTMIPTLVIRGSCGAPRRGSNAD